MKIINKKDLKIILDSLKNMGVDMEALIFKAQTLKKVIIICGPTCTGKSGIALNLAKIFHTDIISIDSMQVYKGMNIGTDKYDTKLTGINQYMVDVFEPDIPFTAVLFRDMCRKIIEQDFFCKSKIPLLAGGSGLYIRSVTDDLEFSSHPFGKKQENAVFDPALSKKIRYGLLKEAGTSGYEILYERLKKIDPVYAKKISKNDSRRIIRALEVHEISGQPFSNFQKKWNKRSSYYNSTFIGLSKEKNNLYLCISDRVESMFNKGFVSEVEELIKAGYGDASSTMQAIGYREVLKFLDGSLTIDQCKSEVISATKKLVKKQLTWFKADPRINWIKADDYDNITNLLIEVISIIWKDLDYGKDQISKNERPGK